MEVLRKPKPRITTDVEIDRRAFNLHMLVLLEDRHMLKEDGTSGQYIIAIETKKGRLDHKRYITDLIKRMGYLNARQGARAIFSDPDKFRSVLGDWRGYSVDPKKVRRLTKRR